jgi:hypothetical protein
VQDSMRKMKHHSKTYLATHSATQTLHSQFDNNDEDAADSALYIDMAGRADDALQEGLHWLRCSAENGVADASYQIGQLYEKVRTATHTVPSLLLFYSYVRNNRLSAFLRTRRPPCQTTSERRSSTTPRRPCTRRTYCSSKSRPGQTATS